MKIQRVIVHDFKALKNVDISFEKDFTPNIFPIGSLNGGGKSTLLQLIFTLLHCSANQEKHQYIQNLLKDYEVTKEEGKKDLATFEIWDDEEQKTVELKFTYYHDGYIGKFITYDPNKVRSISQHNGKLTLEVSPNLSNLDTFLSKLSSNIFIATPLTQPYHFLSKEDKKLLFSNELDYYSKLLEIKKDLKNIFFYDYAGAGNLLELFTKARDKEFKIKIRTGKYAEFFDQILKDLKNFFNNIEITPDEDLTKVIFKKGDIELNPEDLSHGELRRLSMYAWIKANEMDNVIILMDEIEMGLHPAWQFYITRDDLREWASNSQFILTTHSYDVCRALPRSNVKQIKPNLLEDANN